MFNAKDEYGDKTEWNGVMVLLSSSLDTLKCSKKWTNIDDKTEPSNGFAIFIVRHAQMFTGNGRI